MKILGIAASPKGERSTTRKVLEAVLAGAREAGAEAECVDLCALKIRYCVACAVCYARGQCVHQDDFGPLYAKMLAADGMVWGSPNYFHTVTAQMKTLIDRMSDTIHCQMLTGKYACAVSVAGGPGHAETTEYINKVLLGMGASIVGAVGASAGVPGSLAAAEPEARALGRDLAAAIREKRVYPEQEAIHKGMRTYFRGLVLRNKDVWKHEYEHWQSQGEF